MKKKLLNLGIIFFAIYTCACKKSTNDSPVPTGSTSPSCILKSQNDLDDTSTTTYEYANNKVVKVANAKYKQSFVVTYGADKATLNIVSEDFSYTATLPIGSNGKFSSLSYSTTEDNTIEYDTSFYTYDQNGYLIKEISKNTTSVNGVKTRTVDSTMYTISDGNIMTRKRISKYGTTTTNYTYYADKANKSMFSLGNSFDYFTGLIGTNSKNLVKTYSNGGLELNSYTYETNDKGFVTSFIEMDKNSRKIGAETFTYVCN